MPFLLYSLPSGLILNVIKLLSWSDNCRFEDNEDPETEDTEIKWQKGKPFYHWVAVTQFCSKWIRRNVVLECPELWMRIDGRNLNWAEEFVRRSENEPLDVETRKIQEELWTKSKVEILLRVPNDKQLGQ